MDIESGQPAALDELDRLAKLYGVDADSLEDEPIVLSSGDSIGALASLDEFRELGDEVRFHIISAARAARELVELERLADTEPRVQQFLREAPRLGRSSAATSHREGAGLAGQLRRKLRLGAEPIQSMRQFMAEFFPSVAILYADLTSQGPAGLAFADGHRGPCIVLNARGKNENPTVRRFSLAHELCHLLVDWNRQEPIASISGYLHDTSLERERRANAFAVRLLCPESVVHAVVDQTAEQQVETLSRYGIPYAVIRLYLKNEAGTELPSKPAGPRVSSGWPHDWALHEREPELEQFPLAEVPLERRTWVAKVAASLYSEGKLQRDVFASYLGVTPAEEVERVLDALGLDWPREQQEVAG